jgi:beta-fructofuranosidase
MSSDLQSWKPVSTLLDVKSGSRISPTSSLSWGVNFECATFFSFGDREYLIVGVEEEDSTRWHNGHYLLWLAGDLVMENGEPRFQIKGHGILDHGILYAAHIFRDAQGRLLQLGWADEAAKPSAVSAQGWAGCLGHPRELFEVTQAITEAARDSDSWVIDERRGTMTTLGVRPAPQLTALRSGSGCSRLSDLQKVRSRDVEINATFSDIKRGTRFTFNVLSSPDMSEATSITFDLSANQLVIDRSRSSLAQIGASSSEVASLCMLPGEDLQVRIFVDNSIIEVFVNDRLSMTSRVYPSLPGSTGVSYDFADFDEDKITIRFWTQLRNAWPERDSGHDILEELHPLRASSKPSTTITEKELHRTAEVQA